jgi:hypothetical protein
MATASPGTGGSDKGGDKRHGDALTSPIAKMHVGTPPSSS